jgi:hypothetical protein
MDAEPKRKRRWFQFRLRTLLTAVTVVALASAIVSRLLNELALKQHQAEEAAIAVVLADVKRKGGDPHREECSATRIDGRWYVTAWHIWYPDDTGSSRFVPGGFKTYILSNDGKILEVLPGH